MQIPLKLLKIALGWGVVAFTVATVVLAVQNDQLNEDLKDLHTKLDYLESQVEGEVKPRSARSIAAADEEINYRLPGSIIPLHYNLYLHPDIDTGNFTGQETINIRVLQQTKQIIMHSLKLKIESVYVMAAEDDPFEETFVVESFEFDELREFLIINMEKELQADVEYTVGIIFEGQMLNKIVGLYSSTYTKPNAEKRTIATSKFEPTYARQSFPCFDEPHYKATFSIALVHPTANDYHALSNMDLEQSLLLGQYTEARFAKSVPMSTYLACFLISDFAYKQLEVNTNGIGENFNIRIFATAHQLDKVDFALSTAIEATQFYINYFQVEYPLPKLDMAAIPDFASNAMEHWGLVTYRETALLYDSSYSSTWNKQRIAAVVAHELAHMWFGNLVTMMWWNDLWLNEGFARYMEYKSLNDIFPEWEMPEQFLINALHSVMKFDSSIASHPIIQTVENPDQITEIFDTISYEKGASVIRMMEAVVGTDRFAQAVTNYLNKFKYGNAVTNDFLTEVANVEPGFDVILFMRTWTEQMGLPVVEVKRTSDSTFTLTQKRFFSNAEYYDYTFDDSPFNYKWTIPITYQLDGSTGINQAWFNHDQASISITVPVNTNWIKLNSKQIGYYRTNYEENVWRQIIETLVNNRGQFETADRANIVNDIFALADASQLSYEIAMDMTRYLAKERDLAPWAAAATKLKELQRILTQTDFQAEYLQYARGLIADTYNEVGWTVNENNHIRNRLRVTILSAACALGLEDCLTEASKRFVEYLANPEENKPAPDVREIVYYYGMQLLNSEEAWDQMWEIFISEQDASEKAKLMHGLSGIRSPWILHRFITLANDEQNVRRQDYFTCIQDIAANPVGQPIVWEYYREQWPQLVERFGLNDRSFGRLISSITADFALNTKLEDMEMFFKQYPEAGAGTAARQQAVENVKYNINWLNRNKQIIGNWLHGLEESAK